MSEAPTARQVNLLNRLRQMLILFRSVRNRPEDLGLEELAQIKELEKRVETIYRSQRGRCGYPPVDDPLKSRPDNKAGI